YHDFAQLAAGGVVVRAERAVRVAANRAVVHQVLHRREEVVRGADIREDAVGIGGRRGLRGGGGRRRGLRRAATGREFEAADARLPGLAGGGVIFGGIPEGAVVRWVHRQRAVVAP